MVMKNIKRTMVKVMKTHSIINNSILEIYQLFHGK